MVPWPEINNYNVVMTNINLLYALWFVYKFSLLIVIIFELYILIGKYSGLDNVIVKPTNSCVFIILYNERMPCSWESLMRPAESLLLQDLPKATMTMWKNKKTLFCKAGHQKLWNDKAMKWYYEALNASSLQFLCQH